MEEACGGVADADADLDAQAHAMEKPTGGEQLALIQHLVLLLLPLLPLNKIQMRT